MHAQMPATFSREEGRKFGVTVGLAFLALAALLLWREKETAWRVVGVIGTVLLVGGLVIPSRLGPIYRGWMGFALALSKVTTPIFMGIIYFGLFLVTGLLRRALGKNAMVRKENEGTFWVVRETTRANLERQF